MFRLWREADSSELRRFAAWAFSTQPLFSRDTFDPEVWGDCDAWIEQAAASKDEVTGIFSIEAALVLAWYRRSPWTDSELAEKLSKEDRTELLRLNTREMLATLGKAGRRVFEKWDAKEKKR